MAQVHEFADRLDALEARRRRAEERVAAALERAHGLVEDLAARAEVAHAHRQRMREARDDQLPGADAGAADPAGSEARREVDLGRMPAMPSIGGGLRGILDRLGLWLLRPWLEWRRQQQRDRFRELAALVAELHRWRDSTDEALERLGRRQATLLDSLRRGRRKRAEGFSWRVASSQHAVETLAAAMGVHEALVGVADARGAETVHRVTGAVDDELETAFGELGRRQEALLAELVGSRRWLDDVRRRAGAAGGS